MDKKNGTIWIVIAVIIAVFGAVVTISIIQKNESKKSGDETVAVNADNYNLVEVIPASAESGNMPENIVGDPNAPIKIYEYADYQCEGCAAINPYLNKLVEEYDGKVAVVYRGYVLSYHQNGTAAASAANAAALQGYWKPFKDLLFANQDDWYYASASERQKLFEKYFEEASDGKGDMTQFRKDMQSTQVAQKISFDRALAEKRGLEWTPYIWLEGVRIEKEEMGAKFIENMRTKIDARLKELGIQK